jgi:hypothetical protein
MSALFAATYPQRTTALVLYGAYAKRIRTPDYPWAPTAEERERDIEEVERACHLTEQNGAPSLPASIPAAVSRRNEWPRH